MDKEKQVKRYDFCAVNDNSDSGAFEEENGRWVKYEDHAKALSAEREMAEKWKNERDDLYLQLAGSRIARQELELKLKAANAKIVELEGVEAILHGSGFDKCEFDDECDHCKRKTPMQSWTRLSLEGEADSYRCTVCALNEVMGIVGQGEYYRAMEHFEPKIKTLEASLATANKKIEELKKDNKILAEAKADNALRASIRENYELEKELDATNKKAEKLVEAINIAIERINDGRNNDMTIAFLEQAINEFRGGE